MNAHQDPTSGNRAGNPAIPGSQPGPWKGLRTWHWMALALLTVISIAGQLIGAHESGGWWERVPGFWAAFGFVGCVVIIVASKAVGKFGVQRREDYYDEL